MSKIYNEFDRIVKDTFPNGSGGCSLTFKRKKELANFFFLGFRAALGSVIMKAEDSPEAYAATMDALCKEVDEHFQDEVKEVETTEGTNDPEQN